MQREERLQNQDGITSVLEDFARGCVFRLIIIRLYVSTRRRNSIHNFSDP